MGKILTGEIDSPNILSQLSLNVPPRLMRRADFLHLDFRRTEYGKNDPIHVMCKLFNNVYCLFDFSISSAMFKNRILRSNLM